MFKLQKKEKEKKRPAKKAQQATPIVFDSRPPCSLLQLLH
jgi:hypothetical protein